MKIIYKNFIKSFKLLTNWKYLGLGILSDFLFIIAIITSWFFVSNKLVQNYDILQEMSNSINSDAIVDNSALQTLSGQLNVINSTVNNIFVNLLVLVLVVFVVYVVFNGFSWLIIKCIVNKEKFKLGLKYFLKFGGLTLIWFLMFLLLFYLIIQSINEDMSTAETAGMQIFFISYLAILFYFAGLSYAYYVKNEKFWKSLKNAFLSGIKKIYIFVPLFVIIGFIFFVLSFLFSFFINIPFFFIIPLIIFLVLCVWARIYLLLVVKEL